MRTSRYAWVVLLGASALGGCTEWVPLRNAHDRDGERVRVVSGKKQIMIAELVTCDDDGFVIAKQTSDCGGDAPITFDTRKDKISIFEKDTTSSVGIVVATVLASIFVPAGIVGSVLLSGSH